MDARTIEKYIKMGKTHGLKTLEIDKGKIRIEYRLPRREVLPAEAVQIPDPVAVAKVNEYLKRQREAIELDELQLMNPEAYEEQLALAGSTGDSNVR